MRRLFRPECPNPVALKTNYKHPDNKLALVHASNGKCMYCESLTSHVYFGDVEHIKPKSQDKYPELEFEWTNHGYCCARCNNAKSDNYDENCPLIDPYSEEPNFHLAAIGSIIMHKAGSERGALTILTVDLNRAELIEKRDMRVKDIQTAVDSCYRTSNSKIRETLLSALCKESEADKEYSMVAAAVLAQLIS